MCCTHFGGLRTDGAIVFHEIKITLVRLPCVKLVTAFLLVIFFAFETGCKKAGLTNCFSWDKPAMQQVFHAGDTIPISIFMPYCRAGDSVITLGATRNIVGDMVIIYP